MLSILSARKKNQDMKTKESFWDLLGLQKSHVDLWFLDSGVRHIQAQNLTKAFRI